MNADTPEQPVQDTPAEPMPGGEQMGAPGGPSEDELRAAYEAELARVTATDIIAQTVVSLINIGARRLGLTGDPQAGPGGPERDLEQVRDAIDGARALMAILERSIPQELAPLRDALSRLQMAYAAEMGSAPAAGAPADAPPPAGAPSGGAPAGTPPGQAPPTAPAPGQQPPSGDQPGPAESSGRLWVPGR